MRVFVFFLGLILYPTSLFAFEVEDRLILGDTTLVQKLRIISTTDVELFKPVLEEFQQARPDLNIEYVVTSTTELMKAIEKERQPFDIAISSAMDLQTKLANDGLTHPHSSAATLALPEWAKWREDVYAFTQEPAAIVLSRAAFENLELPQNREDLIAQLRSNPELFRGRVGTYDLRSSGLGYLFATQDSRVSEVYWRLTEVMGSLDAKLYNSSGKMIDHVASGELAVAYNVLGSYALSRQDSDEILVLFPSDFTTVMMRTVLIPTSASNQENANQFVDFLVEEAWNPTGETSSLRTLNPELGTVENSLRRIRLDPGLLVFLDTFKKNRFLSAWENSILQK